MNQSKNHIPKSALRFLTWFCHPDYLEDISGDLEERFDRLQTNGNIRSVLIIWLEVIRLFRPSLMKNFMSDSRFNQLGLFANHFRSSYRSTKREKGYALLNIFCLTIGFTACLFVALFNLTELSFDKFHEKADRIYRINQTFIWGDIDELFGSTGPGVMPAVQAEVPEFEVMTRIHTHEDAIVTIPKENKVMLYEEGKFRSADSSFFDVFTFPLIHGNPKTALVDPNSLVITEDMAHRFFGTTDVLGEQLIVEEEGEKTTFQVTGVTQKIPKNSHITFDMLASISSLKRMKRQPNTWWWTTFVTFGVLRADADPELVANKVAQVPGKYLGPFLQRFRGISYEEFIESGEEWDLYIQPLLDIHLRSSHVFSRLNETSDITSLYISTSIAGLILLLSIINFVNLSTARSSRRSKEVGVRKILGTKRKELVAQFITESIMFCLLAVLVSFLLLILLVPSLNQLLGGVIEISDLWSAPFVLAAAGFTTIVGLMAGWYPALYVSGNPAISILRGQRFPRAGGNAIRRILMVLQFSISISLIACALIINSQVKHWLTMDLGFNRDHIIVVQRAERLSTSHELFLNSLRTLPDVNEVSFSSDTPPYVRDGDGSFFLQGYPEKEIELNFWATDEKFADIYGIEFLAGQNFEKNASAKNEVLLSLSAVKALGIVEAQDAIGKHLMYYEKDKVIAGVFANIDSEINWEDRPIAIFNYEGLDVPSVSREISIDFNENLAAADLSILISQIEKQWDNFSGGVPLRYFFLDERFESIFTSTIDFGNLMKFYALLASVIAGLGLTGLLAYMVERRNKEIGIRKTLGASVINVLVLLTSEFGKLLGIGFIIACATSWYLMDKWIMEFENQIDINPLIFLSAGAIMVFISCLTISIQALQAANTNPIKYLRDE